MTLDLELYTVPQAAKLLYKSEQGVRQLVKAGRLTATRAGRRLLFTAESLQAYAAGLPHPVKIMAALYDAQQVLANEKRFTGDGPYSNWMKYHPRGAGTYIRHFLPVAAPVCRELIAAVKVKDYPRAEEQVTELWRAYSDYQMLYAPIKTPRTKAQERKQVHAEQPPLFDGLKGGAA